MKRVRFASTMKLAFVLALTIPALAQIPARLDLTIYDSSGNPIPGARITVSYSVTPVSVGVISDQNGRAVVHLASGSYRVTVQSAVSLPFSQIVNLVPGQIMTLAVRLAQVPVPDVPLRPLKQVLRQAEVEQGQPGGFGGNQGFDVAGLRSQDTNFLVDGFDNNNIWSRTPALLFPSNSIIDVALVSGYVSAQFGHGDAAVSLDTRAGSNQFHASLFEYFQNSFFDSRNFFDAFQKPHAVSNQFGVSAAGRARRGIFFFADWEALRDHQGLTVVSTVPTVAEKSGTFNVPVYDPAMLSTPDGMTYTRQPFGGNQIPLNRISPASAAVLALYPDPNLPGLANNFLFNPTAVNNNNQFLARADGNLTARNSAFVRFNTDRPYQLSPSALPISGSDSTQGAGDETMRTHSWSAAFSDSYIIRSTMRNEFRVAVASVNLNAVANDQNINASAVLGIPGLGNGLPSIQPAGYAALGAYGPVPLQISTLSTQVEDHVSWTTRRHAIQSGFQIIRRYADGNAGAFSDRGTFFFTPDYTSQPGTFTGNSIASLLLGYPDEVRRDVQLSDYHIRGWEWSGYAQDQIQPWRRLTIQAGIRYEYFPPVTDAANHLVNFNFSRTAPALSEFAGQSGVSDYAGLQASHFAFAPRAGLALNLGTARVKPTAKILGNPVGKFLSNLVSGEWVLRAGFSANYDTGAYMFESALGQNAPYASRYDLINGEFATGSTLAQGIPAPVSIVPSTANLNATATPVYAIQTGAYTPYAEVWNLFIEHRILSRMVLAAGGTGARGVHLYQTYNANQPAPGPYSFTAPREPYSPYDWRLDYLGFGGESTYYGGVAKLTGEFWRGIILQVSYAYSKSIDDSAAPFANPEGRPADPQDIFDARANRGLSAFDVPQRAVLLGQYLIPFQQMMLANWRVNALVTLQSGLPFTPQLATSTLNDGGYQLPDRVASGTLSSGRSYQQWFDTAAFVVPPLYQYGDSGIDILRGPTLTTVDLAIARTFPISRRARLTLRLDAFNLLNRANFGLPNRILGVDNSGFIDHTITPARTAQIAGRVDW